MGTAVIGAPECAFDGCDRKPRPLGLCDGHYWQQRHGKDLTELRVKRTRSDDPAGAFWSRVDKGEGCWEWQGATSGGYGDVWWNGRKDRAHRVSYELTFGAVADGMFVDHQCRNRLCVRPEHLREATPKQNAENVGVRVHSRSGLRGVRRDRRGKRWIAYARHNGVEHRVSGSFGTAAEASDAAATLRESLFTHSMEVAS